MLNLRNISGLPVNVDTNLDTIHLDEEVVGCSDCAHVSLGDVSPGLLNRSVQYPQIVYTRHKQVSKKCDKNVIDGKLNYDLFYLPACLLGIEYSKTHYFDASKIKSSIACIVEALSGELIVYIQKQRENDDMFDLNLYLDEAYLVTVKEGEKLSVPAGYEYTFINTTDNPIVFSRTIGTQDHIFESQELAKRNGPAYYIISKNARREVVANPKYKDLPELMEVGVDRFNKQHELELHQEKPLYEQALGKVSAYINHLAV